MKKIENSIGYSLATGLGLALCLALAVGCGSDAPKMDEGDFYADAGQASRAAPSAPGAELTSQANQLTGMVSMASSGLQQNYRCGLTGCICKVKGSQDCKGIGSACKDRGTDPKCTRDFDCPKIGGGMEPCSATEGDLCWCLADPPLPRDPNEPIGAALFKPGFYRPSDSTAVYKYDGLGRSCWVSYDQYLNQCQPPVTVLYGETKRKFVNLTAAMDQSQTCSWAQAGSVDDLTVHGWAPDRRYFQTSGAAGQHVHLLIGERSCHVTHEQYLGGVANTGVIGLSETGTSKFLHAFDTGVDCKDFELIR
jgi:hypothetical protein